MRGGKRTRVESEAYSHRNKQSKYQSIVRTRGRIADDLIGHKKYLIYKARCRKAKLCK
jgi:hypothetical protein